MSAGPTLVATPWFESLRPAMRGGNEVVLLECGSQYFPALASAIDAAQASIFIETYIFADDDSGREIAARLAAAAARGVEVHLVIDGFGTPGLVGEVARLLDSADIAVETFRTERRRFAPDRQRLRRMHRKIAVIDGGTVFVGGINLLDDYNDPNHGRQEHPRLDFAVRVRGPLAAAAHLAMQRLWWETVVVNRSLRRPRSSGQRQPMALQLPNTVTSDVTHYGETRAMLVLRDNLRFRRTIERWYLRSIARAHREVLIASAYFFPGVRMRRALVLAAGRGVRVRLLLQGRVEYRLQHYASQALYDELLRAGVEIVEYRKSFLHAKAAVIDDTAAVGSSNIDPFSLLLAREAIVVVGDRVFAAELRARLDAAIADGGEAIELKRHLRRPWPMRIVNWFAFAILRLGVALSGVPGRY